MSSVGPTAATIAATTAITAAAAQQRRTLLALFHAQGALSAESALPASAIAPVLHRQLAWYRQQGVICEVGEAAFYLDPDALAQQQAAQRRGVRIGLWVMLLVFVLVMGGVAIGLSLR